MIDNLWLSLQNQIPFAVPVLENRSLRIDVCAGNVVAFLLLRHLFESGHKIYRQISLVAVPVRPVCHRL